MSSRFFLASLLIPAFFIPAFAGAVTTSDLESRIAALLAQIKILQTELRTLKLTEVTPTIPQTSISSSFTTTLGKGSEGNEVTKLQTYLAKDPSLYPEGLISGYFGSLTEAAVKRFQAKHNIVSAGTPITTGYGFFGPKTRAILNALLTTTPIDGTTPTPTPIPLYTPNTPNRSPNLSVSGDRIVFLPNGASLSAIATDDGKPSNTPASPAGRLTYLWSKASGPGIVTFSSLTTKDTTATFSSTGNYQITATVSDSDLFASYTIAIVVKDASPIVTPPATTTPLGTLPSPWTLTDIGSPSPLGNASYTNGIFTLKAGGADIWNTADQFSFISQPIIGDTEIIARVDSLTNTNPWAKAGVMIRDTLSVGSPHAMMIVTPTSGLSFQRRLSQGGTSSSLDSSNAGTAPKYVRLVRTGTTISAYYGSFATGPWTFTESITIAMTGTDYIGLVVVSSIQGTPGSALFSNVSITTPSATTPSTPTLTFSANPTTLTVGQGQSTTLTWVSTNTTSCYASDGWSGNKATAGNQSVTPSQIISYTLTCTGGGGSVTQSVTIHLSAVVGETIKQWQPHVLSFTSSQTRNWSEFPLQVTFTHPQSGTSLTLDGYWDGGNTWRVRFAPTLSGTWEWTSFSNDAGLNNKFGTIIATAPLTNDIAGNPNYHGHVKVVNGVRYFTYTDGTPYFLLGDTNWNMVSSNTTPGDELDRWIADRKVKGFTAVMTRFMADREFPGEGGKLPFYSGGRTDLNDAYFRDVDERILYIWNQGLVVMGHPDWIMSAGGFTLNEGINISRYMLARYGAYNIIWSLTGEFQYAAEHNTHWFWNDYADTRVLGDAVKAHNPYSHPVSIHPGGCGGDLARSTFNGCGKSSAYFHTDGWLDHNWVQTHFTWEIIPRFITEARALTPAKPVIESEPCYEGANPTYSTHGECTSYIARMQGWISMLSGAAGYVYGADGTYFADNWSALSFPGSSAVGYMKNFFVARAQWWLATPALDCVSINGATPTLDDMSHPRCAGVAGTFYAVYLPQDITGTAVLRNVSNGTYRAQWYNPRTGSYTTINSALSINGQWGIPGRPDGSDWVVIIDK